MPKDNLPKKEKPPVIGWMENRNGLPDITDLRITPVMGDTHVLIEGVGKSGKLLHGGIQARADVAEEKLAAYLCYRGWKVTRPKEVSPTEQKGVDTYAELKKALPVGTVIVLVEENGKGVAGGMWEVLAYNDDSAILVPNSADWQSYGPRKLPLPPMKKIAIDGQRVTFRDMPPAGDVLVFGIKEASR